MPCAIPIVIGPAGSAVNSSGPIDVAGAGQSPQTIAGPCGPDVWLDRYQRGNPALPVLGGAILAVGSEPTV